MRRSAAAMGRTNAGRGMGDAELIKRPADALADDVAERLGSVVERRHRRQDDGPDLSRARHQTQVSEVQRRLAEHQHQRPALLQGDVGGADEQVLRIAVGDTRERLDRAGGDDHARGLERAAGDRRGQIFVAVAHAGKGAHVARRHVELEAERAQPGFADDQMGRDAEVLERLEQLDAVDDASSASDADDDGQGHRPSSFCPRMIAL